MDDNNQNLSVLTRRRLLGGIGVIGLASAGAGLGTTAFFSDEEAVSAEVLAGRLDLLMDFRSEYYPWENLYADTYPRAPDERFDTDGDGDIDEDDEFGPVYVMGQSPDLRYAARDGEQAGDVLSGEDWAAAARQIRACTDPFSDSSNVVVVSRQDGSTFGVTVDGGTAFGDNLPATGSDANSTFYTNYVDGAEGVLFDLDDVKPKDAGEATLSLHLCDNDAYLWGQPFVRANEENGVVEPEGDDTDATGELADYLWVSLWYDENCNNTKDAAGGQGADVMIVLDRSGSMASETGKFESAVDGAKTLTAALPSDVSVGLTSYGSNNDQGLDDVVIHHSVADNVSDATLNATLDGLVADGGTPMNEALTDAGADLVDNNDSGNPIMVFLTNGEPTSTTPGTVSSTADGLKTDGITIYAIAYGSGANEDLMENISSPPKIDDGSITADDEFAYLAADIGDVKSVFAQIGQAIGGEVCIYEGSLAGLAEDLAAINPATGAFPLDGAAEENFVINDPAGVSCFPGDSTHCIGFEWYLPCTVDELKELGSSYTVSGGGTGGSLFDELVDRGVLVDEADFDINVIQTDTVEFGANFAAVQCRHNMGNMDPFPGITPS